MNLSKYENIIKLIQTKEEISLKEIGVLLGLLPKELDPQINYLIQEGIIYCINDKYLILPQVRNFIERKWIVGNSDAERDEYYDSIACKACKYILENDTIYINTGNSGNMMINYLPSDKKFTLVTNSVIIAYEAYRKYSEIEVFVVGGKLRKRGVCDDFLTLEQIRNYKFDKSFLTGFGFSYKNGLSNTSNTTAILHKTIIENSKQNILLMPYKKIGIDGFVNVVGCNLIDIVITNKLVDKNEMKLIMEANVEVDLV